MRTRGKKGKKKGEFWRRTKVSSIVYAQAHASSRAKAAGDKKKGGGGGALLRPSSIRSRIHSEAGPAIDVIRNPGEEKERRGEEKEGDQFAILPATL